VQKYNLFAIKTAYFKKVFQLQFSSQKWAAGGQSQRMAQPFFGWGFGCETSVASL